MYKRQDMQAVSYEELTRWEEENDMSGNDRIVDALRRSVLKVSNVTVSYTHLDVYKRQLPGACWATAAHSAASTRTAC